MTANQGWDIPHIRWKSFRLVDLFDLATGDFNSFGDVDPGRYPGVSRVSTNNGVVGYYARPDGGLVYPCGIITVSTTSGDAFVQLTDFVVSDKVVLCKPKMQLRPSSLFFIAFSLNYQKWRYSYGRSCFVRTLELASVDLPAKRGRMNEDVMEKIIEQSSYWDEIKKRFDRARHR